MRLGDTSTRSECDESGVSGYATASPLAQPWLNLVLGLAESRQSRDDAIPTNPTNEADRPS